MELYEAMNEKIADIIAIDGTPSSLYASAYIKDLRAENARLNAEILQLSTELAHREEDLVHADEKVFYREMAVRLKEDKIKKQAVKEFVQHAMTKCESDAVYAEWSDEHGEYGGDMVGIGAIETIFDNLIIELYGADE